MHQLRYDLPLFSPRNASPLRDNICSIFPLQETNVTMLHICSSLKTIKSRKIKCMDNHCLSQYEQFLIIYFCHRYTLSYDIPSNKQQTQVVAPHLDLNSVEFCGASVCKSKRHSKWKHDAVFWDFLALWASTNVLPLVTLFCDNKRNQLHLSCQFV